MIEDLKHTELVNRLGGRFKLSALIQKRMFEIMHGARPLIEDTQGLTMMEIVVREIVQEKIAIEDEVPAPKPPEFKL